MTYTIHAKIASREYHVYKNINWENVKAGEKKTIEIETNKDYIKIDPYCCAVKAMVRNLPNWSLSVILPGKFQDMSTFS